MTRLMFLLLGADERGLLEVEVSPDEDDWRCFCCSAAARCLVGPAMVVAVGLKRYGADAGDMVSKAA